MSTVYQGQTLKLVFSMHPFDGVGWMLPNGQLQPSDLIHLITLSPTIATPGTLNAPNWLPGLQEEIYEGAR